MQKDIFSGTKNFLDNVFKKFKKEESRIKPFADIFETRQDLVIRVDMPGVKKEDIKIKLNPTTLEVSSQISKQKVTKTDSFYKKERKQSQYYRCGDLPIPVDPNSARATYEAGVLEIRARKAKTKKLVKVKRHVKKKPTKELIK